MIECDQYYGNKKFDRNIPVPYWHDVHWEKSIEKSSFVFNLKHRYHSIDDSQLNWEKCNNFFGLHSESETFGDHFYGGFQLQVKI